MRHKVIWTISGAAVGLALAVLGCIPPNFPSKFWEIYFRIAPIAMKPATLAYRWWVPLGQEFSFFRYFTVNILQWLVLGFLAGAGVDLFMKRRRQKCANQSVGSP
jgi:hypothetical protein